MQKLIGSAMLLAVVCGYSTQSHATLIDEGNTTLDTSTNLEWLDLTATAGLSINAILGGADNFISDGWKFATFSQVDALFGDAGAAPDQSGAFVTTPAVISAAQELSQLMGVLSPNVTFFPDPRLYPGTSAFVMSDDGTFAAQFTYQVAEDGSSARLWDASVAIPFDPSTWNGINSSVGSYLVRAAPTTVPEPTVLSLLALGLTMLGLSPRKRTTSRSARN